jgi:PAS domain S-box-containing protein
MRDCNTSDVDRPPSEFRTADWWRDRDVDFFRTLVENTSDAIVAIDETSTIVYANPAIERLFGYAPTELVGRSLLTLVPESLRERHLSAIRRYVVTGERTIDWDDVAFRGRHRDGRERDVSLSFRELGGGENRLFAAIIRDVTEQRARKRELERYSTIVETVGDAVYQLDLDGRFVAVNDVVVAVSGYSRDELVGAEASLVLSDEDARKCVETIHDLLSAEEGDVGVVDLEIRTADGAVVPVEDRIALLRTDGEVTGTVGVARDVTEQTRRDAQLERQRNELAEQNRINAVIRGINQSLATATTREEIERTVCERLARSESYVLAWIGELHPSGRRIESRVRAGVDEGTVGAGVGPGDGLMGAVVRSGRCRVVRDVLDDPDSEPWRDHATARGYRSIASVPISYGDTTYGAINLCSARPDGFPERELDVLCELGETIGHVINAVESKRLLHADAAVELVFRVNDAASFFVAASARFDCTVRLEGVVPVERDRYLYYVTVTGVDPDDLLRLAEREAEIREARLLNERDGESLFLFDVAGASAVMTLIEAGAQVKRAEASGGSGSLVAHVAPDADVGTVVEAVASVFPESELVAQREITRPVQTRGEFRDAVSDRLTAKQRGALEAAYRGGYFARPRSVTGSDLAASFGVTPSTFHHHLQAGLNKVVGAVFDGSSST